MTKSCYEAAMRPERVYIVVKAKLRETADLIGIKEALGMYCERFGDVEFVTIAAEGPEQLSLEGVKG